MSKELQPLWGALSFFVIVVIVLLAIFGLVDFIAGDKPSVVSTPTVTPKGTVTGCTQEFKDDSYIRRCKQYNYYEINE